MFTLHLHRRTIAPSAADLGGRRVNDWRDESGVACAYGHAGDGWWAVEWPGWAIFRFGPAVGPDVEVTCLTGTSREQVQDTYRRSVLPLQLQALGDEALHASAVSTDEGVIAFCGERRSGKSTLAFALDRAGLPQRADDALALAVRGRKVATVPLPFAPRLRRPSAAFFATASPGRCADAADTPAEPLRAVFELEQDDTQTPSIERLTGGYALSTLLTHAHCFEPDHPGARRRLVEHYLTIAAVTPVFRMRYAPRLAALPDLVDSVLAVVGARMPVAR